MREKRPVMPILFDLTQENAFSLNAVQRGTG